MPAGKTLVQLLALSGLRATMQASQTDRQTDEWTDGRTDRWRDYTNSPSYCVVCIAENCQKVPFNHAVFGTGVITVSSSSWLVMLFVFYMPTMHPARIYQLWIGKYHNYEHYRNAPQMMITYSVSFIGLLFMEATVIQKANHQISWLRKGQLKAWQWHHWGRPAIAKGRHS